MKGGNIIFNVCQLAVRFVDKGIHSDVALVCWLVMLVIGLTGSIASGKSTTCQILARIAPNLPIIDADKLSHEATKKDNLPYLLLRYIVLPTNCFEPRTGELNRAQLAALIFAPTEKAKCLKKIVERCIHPWVIFRMLLAMCYYWICGYSRVVLDIPLLFEVKLSWMCSKTVLIDVSSEELQLERLLKRNPQMTLSEAKNRIASQFSLERKRKLADIIIVNSGNIHELEKHILKAFQSKSLNPNPIVQLVIFLILPESSNPGVPSMKSKTINVSKRKTSSRSHKKNIDLNSLDTSFVHLQQSKTSFKPVQKTKIVPVKPKIQPLSREAVDKAGEDLSRILQNF